jgi:hypothetical protein
VLEDVEQVGEVQLAVAVLVDEVDRDELAYLAR